MQTTITTPPSPAASDATGPAQPSPTTFAALGVPAPLVDVLAADGKTTAFPIQVATLPSTLDGRDVLGRGKTGSGKTIAFALPLVTRLAGVRAGAKRRPGRPLGLVLAPTRELATQIAATVEPLASALGLRVTTVYGGVSQKRQEAAFRAGVDIVIACPGRLDDLMKQRIVSLDDIAVTVLDEADHMADLGFLPIVTRILNATPRGGQRLLFSATLDNGVDDLVRRYLSNPVRHSVDEATSHVAAMTHHVFEAATPDDKTALVRALASGVARRILFTRTKHQAKKLARQLTQAGIPAVDLHGNLSQNARDRNLAQFTSGEVRVLVATDVAARGVHVDGVDLVVHVDPPVEHKAYLHRSGRTARAGSAGDVVTLTLPAQRRDTAQLLKQAKIRVQPQQVTAASDAVRALVGDVAPTVKPVPGGPGAGNAVAAPQGGGRSQGANARRKRAARDERQPQSRGVRTDARGGRGAGAAAGSGAGAPRGERSRRRGGTSGSARAAGATTVYSTSSAGSSAGRGGGSSRRGGHRRVTSGQ